MKKFIKPRKVSLPILDEIRASTTELEKVQVRDRIELAMRIEEALKLKGFKTNKEFALHINRSASEVSRWLSGYHNLTQNTLSEIALGLDLSICDLFNSQLNIQTLHVESSAISEISITSGMFLQAGISRDKEGQSNTYQYKIKEFC